MPVTKFGIGQPVHRVEDQRFITGKGVFTADIQPYGALSAVFVRSPHAHAKFAIGDISAARAMPGVKAILTAADVAHIGDLPCLAPMRNADGTSMHVPSYPVLARTHVRHVGDAIAMIVAETEAQAREASEALEVTFEPLPSVTDLSAAIAQAAPLVHSANGSNIAYANAIGDKVATDAIFAKAERIVAIDIVNNRLVANFMEPRAAIGEYDAATKGFTLTTASQGVHGLRDCLVGMLGISAKKLRVITPDVGGGFGTKAIIYREYPLVLEAARLTGRPVKWVADRSEHFVADTHGRDNVTKAGMALDSRGKFLALRLDIIGNLGAYAAQFGPYIHWLGATMATGPYHIPALHVAVRGVYTHTVPIDAYRGAGRPEAAYVLERLVDQCARALNMKRDEIRLLNFVTPEQMPYATLTGRRYDVGDFGGAMKRALENAEWDGFEARAEAAKSRNKLAGIGFASYIECTAWGEGENGSVELAEGGTFVVRVGTQSNGQGHATAYAQVVSHHLGVPLDKVRVLQGDTAQIPTGGGTSGSRSIPVGAAMISKASARLADQLKDLAADRLEAAKSDLEIAGAAVRVIGTDREISFAALAALPGSEDLRKASDEYVPADATYPNGTHVCEVEIDPETGETEILRYTICDDFGLALNPLLLAGQVHGGIAQGVGQALMERMVYGEDGQPLSASLLDYCLPRAADLPFYSFETRNIPSTTNPLGLKGAGEAGSIGASPAVMNAVVDALYWARKISHIDMPATPARIFAALEGKAITLP
ncbi:MAG: xanthine dehydrogenase family protein molybdopterin-binding subunit [Beijerinckiaceae bacterium]